VEGGSARKVVMRDYWIDAHHHLWKYKPEEYPWTSQRSSTESTDKIVPNWQVLGRANPGDAYIKNFGTEAVSHHRALICDRADLQRYWRL
jgi:hypothetical protein